MGNCWSFLKPVVYREYDLRHDLKHYDTVEVYRSLKDEDNAEKSWGMRNLDSPIPILRRQENREASSRRNVGENPWTMRKVEIGAGPAIISGKVAGEQNNGACPAIAIGTGEIPNQRRAPLTAFSSRRVDATDAKKVPNSTQLGTRCSTYFEDFDMPMIARATSKSVAPIRIEIPCWNLVGTGESGLSWQLSQPKNQGLLKVAASVEKGAAACNSSNAKSPFGDSKMPQNSMHYGITATGKNRDSGHLAPPKPPRSQKNRALPPTPGMLGEDQIFSPLHYQGNHAMQVDAIYDHFYQPVIYSDPVDKVETAYAEPVAETAPPPPAPTAALAAKTNVGAPAAAPASAAKKESNKKDDKKQQSG